MQGSLRNRQQRSVKTHTLRPLAGVWNACSFQRKKDSRDAVLTVASSELRTMSRQRADATPLPGTRGVIFAAFGQRRPQPARGREVA